jgi:hypothetical protein
MGVFRLQRSWEFLLCTGMKIGGNSRSNENGGPVMDKRKYYVSVQAKTIMEHQGDAAYELEIEATPQEVHQLQELFESENETDFNNYIRMHSPEILKEELVSHARLDQYLTHVYRLLYELGTSETRSFVQSMNVLQGLQNGYRDDF